MHEPSLFAGRVRGAERSARQREIDWTTAKVRSGALRVRLRGRKSKGWARRFERVVALLDRPGADWDGISLHKKTITVTDVQEGSESALRHVLESVVLEVNAALSDGGSSEVVDEPPDPAAERERRMTEEFRSFAASAGPLGVSAPE